MWVKLALLATAERIVGSYRGVAPGSAGQEINALSASLFFLLKILYHPAMPHTAISD